MHMYYLSIDLYKNVSDLVRHTCMEGGAYEYVCTRISSEFTSQELWHTVSD